MHFHNSPGERQSYAGPFAAWVELIEQAKYSFMIGWIDPNSIVFDKEQLLASFLSCPNLNARHEIYPHLPQKMEVRAIVVDL
jgi:hypothetical protein